MKANKFGSFFTNYKDLPKGCKLCLQGAKMVLFVTGKCRIKCWYCPISFERKNKDVVYANERPVFSINDAITEAKEMNALGIGITGGEPLFVFNKTLFYLKALKKVFGYKFHAHLYTYGKEANKMKLEALRKAGLDEIRFHSFYHAKKYIQTALKTGMDAGIEVPCIPGKKELLKEIVDFCADNGIFLNLNEFEFSDTNWDEMLKHGFKREDESYAVKGSRALGKAIVKYAEKKGLRAHFCSVRTKFMLQLTKRLKRRANIIKKPWQKVNKYGFLVYGAIECSKDFAKKHGLYYDSVNNLAETDVKKAKNLAKRYKVKAWKIVLYPIYKPWIFEKQQL